MTLIPHFAIAKKGKQEFGLSHYEAGADRAFIITHTLCAAAYGFLVA
ncbi:hypothetical protein W01_00860 [Candidatus Nitrotoga sp. AM1P]|nr:hypothetical protein W01_00860 [Candidatus Nitrotoga sp. AM1P]